MNICGMEKYSMVDYPDRIACTLFTLSCNFCCPFCQNSSLVVGANNNHFISIEEVLDYLNKRKKMLDAVCVSGGEPTLQADLIPFLKKIKDETGLLIKLDTNGSRPEVIEEILSLGLIDFIAMDIKNSPSSYGEIIGIDGYDPKDVIKSIELIKNSAIDYEFRTTLVKEFHSDENMEEIGKLLGNVKAYKLQKFEDRGSNIKEGLSPVPKKDAERFVGILKKYIENVSLRNYD
ncbi:MAG: anaerobic ribonucleoside-triphosphate reductase activating protein [Clostridia bacterium]|nr:anaerobic ribonucleoside-triphosphate reductase activating protein [Clostridia bacterium]